MEPILFSGQMGRAWLTVFRDEKHPKSCTSRSSTHGGELAARLLAIVTRDLSRNGPSITHSHRRNRSLLQGLSTASAAHFVLSFLSERQSSLMFSLSIPAACGQSLVEDTTAFVAGPKMARGLLRLHPQQSVLATFLVSNTCTGLRATCSLSASLQKLVVSFGQQPQRTRSGQVQLLHPVQWRTPRTTSRPC
jgi:hypothetical protein